MAELKVEIDPAEAGFDATRLARLDSHYEEGGFELKDPVEWYVPSFGDVRVWRGGSALAPVTEPAKEPVRIWNLLTHTSGLTYGFHHTHPVDAMYRATGFEWSAPPGKDLAQASTGGVARRARRSGSTRARRSRLCSSRSCCRRAPIRSGRS